MKKVVESYIATIVIIADMFLIPYSIYLLYVEGGTNRIAATALCLFWVALNGYALTN